MVGTILKAISSFYYVEVEGKVYECRARGVFKHVNQQFVVGDRVKIAVIDEEQKKGIIEKVFPRKNIMIRPPIANATQAILVFSVKSPDPNLSLIDRFMVTAQSQGLHIVICLSKIDLDNEGITEKIVEAYSSIGYPIVPISGTSGENIDLLKEYLKENVTIVAGPSGAGKSTLLNRLIENSNLKTGEVSEKIGRGRHTTRHVELIEIGENSLVADSPGFSSINLDQVEERDLKEYFPEFHEFDADCRFGMGCIHENEPDCEVKAAVESGEIPKQRYNSYIQLLKEIRDTKKRRNY